MIRKIKKEIYKLLTAKLLTWVIVLPLLLSCANQPKEEKKTDNTITNIPAIVKGLEALGNIGKKEVDKDEKK